MYDDFYSLTGGGGTGTGGMAWTFDWTWLLLILAFVISIWAQAKVSGAYRKFSQVSNQRGISGAQMAQNMLGANNVTGVAVNAVRGQMTDHFDPRNNTVNLSEGVYGKATVASIAIAAHECGHVMQHETNYAPMNFRTGLVPVVNICSKLAFPLIIIGIFFAQISILTTIGIWVYFGVVLFQLVTLPVEFNASGRAMKYLESSGMLNEMELEGAKKMLSAAAMTYVAAMLSSFLTFLRLLLIRGNRR